jgi:hypothetical protein
MTAFATAQSITLTDNIGCNPPTIFNLSGSSGSPVRNKFTGTNAVPNPAEISWNNTLSRWEIKDATSLVFYNTTATAPNPPGLTNGTWVEYMGAEASASCTPGNFIRAMTGDVALPIEMIRFDANTEGSKTQLTWAIGNEINSHSFDIERSQDGKTFTKIGTVKAQGKAANYSFTDNSPLWGAGGLYYHLKQMDNDQTFEYSKVISVQNGKGKTAIKIYPTTTKDVLTVENNGLAVDVVTVFNQVGQLVFTAKQVNRVDMSSLPAGLYLVQVQAGQEKVTEKVLKQ